MGKYCGRGRTIIHMANRWISGLGFMKKFTLPKSFKNSFFGKTLKSQCSSLVEYRNFGHPQLQVLEELLQFNILAVRAVSRRDDHLSSCGVKSSSLIDYPELDISYIYRTYGTHIVSMKPPLTNDPLAFVKAFKWYTATLIAVSIIAAGAALWWLLRFDGKPASLQDCLFLTSVIACWDCINIKSPSAKVSILLFTFMLAIFIIVTFYTGEVTSYMVNPQPLYPPVDSLEQIRDSNMSVLVERSDELPYLKQLGLQDKVVRVPVDRRFHKITDNPKIYVTIASGFERTLRHYFSDMYGRHRFHTSKQRLDVSYLGFFFFKHAVYKEAININMIRMWDHGVMLYLERQTSFKTGIKMRRRTRRNKTQGVSGSPEPKPINLSEMVAAFIVLVGGGLISLIAYYGEFICGIMKGKVRITKYRVKITYRDELDYIASLIFYYLHIKHPAEPDGNMLEEPQPSDPGTMMLFIKFIRVIVGCIILAVVFPIASIAFIISFILRITGGFMWGMVKGRGRLPRFRVNMFTTNNIDSIMDSFGVKFFKIVGP